MGYCWYIMQLVLVAYSDLCPILFENIRTTRPGATSLYIVLRIQTLRLRVDGIMGPWRLL